MEGIRGFNKNMCATLGKGVYRYTTSGTYIEPECKARCNGFHFVEYAPDCLGYYGLGKGNRYFLINAGGDINEEQGQVCSCTEMTLLKELNMEQFVIKTMEYMVRNPRMDWERNITMCQIARDIAAAERSLLWGTGLGWQNYRKNIWHSGQAENQSDPAGQWR